LEKIMTAKILITGSSGLVGTSLIHRFLGQDVEVRKFDLNEKNQFKGDVRDPRKVRQAVEGCDGIIHLAAVSRVIWGQQDPDLCWATNVGGLNNLLEAIEDMERKPWVVFASSREVYGEPNVLPVDETCALRPVNVYGRSKVEGERLIEVARAAGLRASIVRLSNVYGSTADHADRVIPAFAKAAATGDTLHLEGASNTFDFTHIEDVSRGILTLSKRLIDGGEAPPPIHFVGGVPTTLGELAELAIELAGSQSEIAHAAPRNFDVAQFFGNRSRAAELLNWTPEVSLREGLARLINAYRKECTGSKQEIAS
jgi:nucleoside-diphosphate-sugar epimerase